MVLPIVAAFALVMVWMLSVGIAQIRAVDASRDAARALARGEDRGAAVALARRTAPEGAEVRVDDGEGLVRVTVSLRAEAPGWLLVPLPAVRVDSSSAVEVEGDAAAVG